MVVGGGEVRVVSLGLLALEGSPLWGVCGVVHIPHLTHHFEMHLDGVHHQECYARRLERGSTPRGARHKFLSGIESQ